MSGDVTHLPRRRILVAEDDESLRGLIAEVLRDVGYDVVCAANGEQALRELSKVPPPNLLLLDLTMPIMSGWELLERMRASGELSRIPVAVVSATSPPGVGEYLAKPLDIDRLLSAVRRLAR
jgi:two-component system response regulator CpxR